MTKRFHHVTISVFLKENENLDFLELPVSTETFFEQQFRYDENHERTKIFEVPKQQCKLSLQDAGGFDHDLRVINLTFNKITHTNQLFTTVFDSLSAEDKEELRNSALERTDSHGRFSIRLDKKALEQGTYVLGKGVQYSFLLAAYPKNEKTIKDSLQNLLA